MGDLSEAANINSFDTSTAVESSYSLLKDGKIPMKIVNCEIVNSVKNANNKNLMIEYRSMDDSNPGSMREWIVIKNSNDTAEEIGHNKIKSLGKSAGVNSLDSTSQLMDKNVCLEVGTKPREDKPDLNSNVVNRYVPFEEWNSGVDGPAPTQTSGSWNN